MIWQQYLSAMERYAIKTDDMATEDAYFLATHMPFSQLEVYQGGRTTSTPKLLSEEDVFDQLIHNPDNAHRMIIVRGDNGTGKSHLIRYLKAKLENSASTIYNPDNEQLIFLRRLNNSVRGVFSQLIEQHVIKDPDVELKLRKFVDSSDSKDESAFKTDILFAYVAAVSNDVSGDTYKNVVCRDIASYLSDSRVRERLLREGGAISRCYNVITAPSNQVLKDTTVFSEDDFLDDRGKTKIIKAVVKQGDPQASDFATTLLEDESEITKLVNYLNRFTRDVVQRCADISSESTKTVFEQLRKDLKRQGKNLTLFIEDFTGFTGIDSELITVLSTEHGGDYADLCRVTAIIGITNDYYDQFRDNFTDRVTHQISVTDRSYGTSDFLVEMAGRYLNAIYCNPDALRQWEKNGADIDDLPVNDFAPPCEWEHINLGGKEVTLYPFTSHSLTGLYECLPVKSPRTFLKDVIRAQLKEYFDGKIYGEEWAFPLNPKNIQMSKGEHSSAIDRLATLTSGDRTRLKSALALWADGTASGVRTSTGRITFGGLDKAFLDDIGLSKFSGVGEIVDESSGEKAEPTNQTIDEISPEAKDEPEIIEETTPKKKPVDKAAQDYARFKADISAWFSTDAPLQYHPDYRKMMQAFICGDNRQCGAIDWQDIGIPAYIVAERLNDVRYFFIEGQDNTADRDKALVYMERSAESRDALHALIELRYNKGWAFDGSVYYQQRLITWLERNKEQIIKNVIAVDTIQEQLPIIQWCLALQYLRALILGNKLNLSSPIKATESLFSTFRKNDKVEHEAKEWNELIQFVRSRDAEFETALRMLKKASSTTMGAIQFSRDDNDKRFYRGDELIAATEHLIEQHWDIEQELPAVIPENHLLFNSASLLKALYPRIRKVMAAESACADNIIAKIKSQVGEITQENMVQVLSDIQELFAVFNANSIFIKTELRTVFEKPPIETAKQVIRDISLLSSSVTETALQQLPVYAGENLHSLADFLRHIQAVAQMAEQEEHKATRALASIGTFSGMEALSENAHQSMTELYDLLEGMEVIDDASF